MPIYISGGKTYNIPDEKAEKFEASHPDAKVTIYNGGKTYNIPIGKQSNFKAQFPEWSYNQPSQPTALQTKPVATTMVDSAREYANANARAQLMEDSGKVAEQVANQPLVKSDTTTPDSNVQNMPVEPVKVQPKQNTLVDTDEINEQYAPDKVLGIANEVSSLDDAPKQEHEPINEEDAEYTRRYIQEHEGYDIYEYIPDTFKVANQGKTETQIIAEWFNIANESKHQYLQQQQTQEREKAEVADSLMRSQQNWLPEEAAAWRAKTIAQTEHDPYQDVPQTFVAKFPEGTSEDEIYWAWTHENDASKDEWELKDKTLYVDNIYTRAKAKQQEDLKAENAIPSYSTTTTGAIGTDVAKGLEDTQRLSTQTIRAIDKANELLEAYKAHQGDENFFVGAFKGFRDGISDIDNWVGVYMLGQMTALQDIMAKQEAGEELSQEEQDLVDALAYQMAVEASVANELGWGYTSGKTTGASLPFMLQMIASPATSATNAALKGLDKVAVYLGKNAVKKYGKSVLKKMLSKKATRAVVRGMYKVGKSKVGKAVAATVTGTPRAMIEGSIQTVLFHTDRVTADAIDRQMGNEMVVERANELFGTQMEAREGKEWTRSVLEAFATQASENVTEYLGTRVFAPIGGMIGRALAPLEAKAVGTMFKVADKMGVGDVMYRLVNLPKSQFLTGLAGRGQWNGLFGEYLEEVVNNGVNVLLGNMDAEDFVSLEQNAETLLGLAWTSLGFGVANGVSRVKQYAKAQEDINHVLRAAELAWTDNKQEWESWKARIDEMSYDELREEMRRLIVANSMATAEQRGIARERTRLAMQYMLCRSQLMGLDATDAELRETSTRTPSWMQAEDAQADGIVADEEGQADIVAELTEAHQVLTEASGMDAQAFVGQYGQSADEQLRHIDESPLDANTKAAAKAYILANERYEGVAAVAEAEIERKVRAAEEEVRANINPETNTAIRVSMKTGNEDGKVIDVEAYVIAGNINESGAVTLRMADGSQQMVQANKLTLVSETEADILLEGAREAARQEAVAEVAGRMSNHVPSQAEMPMEVGHRVVVNGEHGSIVATDGLVTRVQLDNGTEVDFAAEAVYDEAQYNKVSERSARAKEHVAEAVVNDKRKSGTPTPMRAPKAEAQIPTDANGAKQYDQAEPQAAWESILAKAKGNAKVAQAVIAEEIEILQSQVKALESASIPVVDNMDQRIEMHMQRQAEIDAINDKIARWQEVAGRATQTSEAVQESVPQSAEAQEAEAAMYAAEQERINRLIPTLDDVSTGETTAEEFVAGLFGAKGIRITPDSFRRETGLGTEEQRRLVGIIAGKDKGGVSIERAAEIILDNYSSELEARGFTGDSSDVRGIIIDILGSGNPRSYAKQASLMRAEKELSQMMQDFDRYTQEAYRMSAEEYIMYEESLLPLYLEQYKGFDEIEYFNNFVDEIENYENYDTSRESTATSGSSEVLHQEQPSITRGDRIATEGEQGRTLQSNVQGEAQNGPSLESPQQIAKEHNAQIDVARLAEETGVSEEEIKQVIDFANKVGVKLNFADYTTTEQGDLTNGEAYASRREITISKLMLAEGKSLRWIMGHELTHIVKTQGTQEEWEAFRDFIKNTIGEKSWNEGIESRTKLYKEAYKNQSVAGFEAAMEEELCADQAGYIFFDASNIDRFLGVPRTLAQKIYDWFIGLVSNVPNNVKVAVELWGQMAQGNVEVSTDEEGKKYSIVGVTGARALDKAEGTTVRMDNMSVAEEMEAAGKDAETIWMATGWERGTDGKWRYDIMDYIPEFVDQTAKKQVYEDLIDAKTKEYEAATNPTEKHELRMKIGEYMDKSAELSQYFVADILGEDHPLIKAYPDLGNITIEFNPNTEDCGYYPVIEQIELGTKNEDAATNARNLAHELQHAIQHAEGFARGGNISSANVKIEEVKNILGINDKASIYDIITYLEHGFETPSQNKALTDLAKKEGYDNAIDYVSSLNPIGYYNRLAGEVESRNVSARLNMSEVERRQTPPSKSEDIAREEQIVLEDESIVKHSISPLDMSEEEKLRRGEMLRNAPAVDVQSNTIVATPELSARKVAEQWWEENVPEAMIYDTEVGEVEINKNSIESSLAHRYGQKKLDAITSLVEGFENAVYLGTLPDSRERGVVDHYFAYPINYDGKRNYVFCRAMQDANKNRLYVHEVFVEDKITKGNTLQTAASKPHGGISLYRDILANVLSASKDTQSVSTEQTDKKEISEKSAESKVEVTKEEIANDKKFSINDNNVASYIYNMDATRSWMWVLRNSPKGVRAKGYGYIDKDRLEEFQDWYDIYLDRGADEYIQALEELKNKATKKAQEYIDEVIAGVEKHRDDFRRLAEGDDSVLSTSNAAKFSLSAEEQSIIDAAKANGTYMKASNGKPTNLNEKQWAQVRTQAFKDWFGDWEKILRIEKLRGSNPIVVKFNGEYELNRDSAKQWMKDNLRGEYINADTGEKIQLSKVGINEVTAHGSKDEAHLKSLSAIPSMIEGAVFIDELANSKGHDKYDSYRYYACGLIIDGVDYTAKIVIGVKDGSRYYDHRLTEIEKGTLLDNLNGLSNSVAEMQNTSSSVGKDTKLISILQTNASKIVDENGEPMVVYHYTPNEFTEFDTEKIGSSTDVGAFGTGFYLSPSDGFSLYGDKKMALFVNAKNPMRLNDSNAFDAKEPFFKKDYEWTKESAQAFADDVQAKGYDAVYYENRGMDEIVAFNPNQIKSATENNGEFSGENNDIRYSISTYHGSGAKFDKFDHAFMGSGEGAQAFGWGTYVTEVEGIAKAYADSSSGNIFLSGFGDFYLRKIREALANGETFEKVKQNLLEYHKQMYEKTGGNRELYGDFISDYEKLQSLKEEDLPARNLYTVEIPDDNGSNYLEWDKAINENIQQRIANGLKNIGFEVEPETNHLTLSRGKNRAVLNIKAKGMDLYAELEDVLGSAKAASQFLSDLGYTGIKYPAQATTGGRADNAQNYVIFNESDAQIVDHRRFSIPTRLQQLNKAEEFIKSSILGKRRNKSFEITLPIAVLKEIKKALGRDFDSHNIDGNSFVHAKKEHGINGQKNNMSSIPLRDEDFALAPYIMVAPDLVQKGNMDAAGRESIRFIKNIDNGEVIVVEKEQKNSPDDMDTITMWADLSSNVLDARQRRPLSTTSETVIISSDSVAKIRKDAEKAIRADVEYLQKQANVKSGEQKYSLSPIPGRMQGESFIDYAHRVAAEVERQRQWQRTGLQRALALNQYEERVASGWYQTLEALQDSMLGLKALMQSIVGDGTYIEDIPDHENPYLGENRLSSVNQAEAELFAKLMVKPMLEEVSKLARNDEALEELTDYVMARHGLERNLMMAAKEAQQLFNKKGNTRSMADIYSECRKKDYAGLTALTGEGKVADAEVKAQQMVDAYEAAHYTDALWDKINALNNAILLKQKESGMLSEKLYQEISGMYDYYIPLRGFDETTIVDVYAYLDTKPMGEGAVQMRAKGRRSKANSPWAYMQSMADQVIMQGNRNKLVKQKLLNFVMNHPSDAVSISRVYLKYNADENRWEMESPKFDGNETEQEKAAKWAEFASDMEDLSQQHPSLYKTGREAVNMKYKVPNQDMLGEHQVLVRTAVGDFVITVQGNPRAAQAANGLTNPDNPQGWMARPIRYAESINRHLSNVYTSANPDFVYSNWVRDSLFGNTMVWIKESPRYAAKFHLNWMKYNPVRVNNLLNKWENNELDMSDPTEAMFYDFMVNGGETGYTSVRDIEAHKDAIKKELKKMNSGVVRSVLSALIDKLTNIARGVENGTRFAAYVTSMEEGRGIGRSIWDAKEISVNFNKKGAGARFVDKEGQTVAGNAAGVVSGFGRSLHVFWNAALQGTTNFGRQAKRHPVKALTALSTMYGLGYLVAMASAWDDDDDKKEGELGYLDIPEYTRRSNIVIKTVAGHWLTVPLPIEYRAVYGMGELCATVMSGKVRMSDGELAGEMAKMAAQAALPVDIFAGDTWWWNVITPSSLAPMVSAYRNVSWTGVPIYKETPFNEAYPEWTKAYKGADTYLVEATRWLSDATGGDKSKPGMIDLNPAQIEYILDGYLGGWSTMTKNLVKTGEMVFGKREYDARNIPIWRRMFTMANDQTENRNANEMYWDMKKVYDEVSRLQRDYEKYIKNGESEYIEKLNALRESQDFKVYQKLDQHMSHINDLNRRIKEAKEQGNSEEEKNANVELMILKKRIVEEINKMLDDARNM